MVALNGLARLLAPGVALGVAAAASACDRSGSRPLPGPSAAAAFLQVDGPADVAPGATASLTARVVRSGVSGTEVTRVAEWASRNPDVALVDSAGIVRGLAIGDAVVEARHDGLLGLFNLKVLPGGTHVVMGYIAPMLAGQTAKVTATWGGQSLAVETLPGLGTYRLLGLAGPARLTASLDGFIPQTVTLDVRADTRQDFRLVPDPATTRWTLQVTPSPSCNDMSNIPAEPLRAQVTLVIHGEFAVLLPDEQPDVLFEGRVEGNQLRIELADVADDYYPPGVRLRSPSGARFEALVGVVGHSDASGYSGKADGYIVALGANELNWGGHCLANDHRFTLAGP